MAGVGALGDKYGPELLRISDRHQRESSVLAPPTREIITELARNGLHSYRQLPINFYQIQMKFRDEIRPRFGVMRAREFLMKDAYSFHLDQSLTAADLRTHARNLLAHFTRCGLRFRQCRRIAEPSRQLLP